MARSDWLRLLRWFAVPMLAAAALARQPAEPTSRPDANQPATTSPETVPVTSRAAGDEQRLNDLITLIEGPTLPVAHRRTGARELLRLDWAETPPRLAAILAGQNTAAKTAVALALADVPKYLKDDYIDPLVIMLGDSEADARRAAAAALAGYRDSGVTPRLREMMLEEARPLVQRLAAVDALGMTTQRAAAAALVEALAEPSSAIFQPALAALEQVTAKSFHGDPEEARTWWKESEALPQLEWQQAQIDRLIQRDREMSRRLRELEGRLVDSYREDYVRAPEAERPALLQGFLADSAAMVRLLGLDLAQRQQGEGKKLPTEIVVQLRALLLDTEPEVRAASVQAVARLRDAADADRFLELLSRERHVKVRQSLVNGLGYVGTGAAAEPLLAIVRSPSDPCLTEAVAAVGRLAERSVLDDEQRATVATALLETFEHTSPADVALRERTLWAMSLLADPRFGEIFAGALAETESVTVRQAAVRGIVALKDPARVSLLVPLVRDPDAALRRTVVEALAELAARDEHLTALWSRIDPAKEPDESIRQAAWRGVVRLLSSRKAAEVESWISRLPQDDPERGARTVELLRIIEASLADDPEARGDLGRILARLAAERASTVPPDDTVADYLTALDDLQAARSAETPRVAAELLRFALLNARYNGAIASALAGGNRPLDGATLWDSVKGEIEQRLTREKVDQAVEMLAALQSHPPAVFSSEVKQAVAEMSQRAGALKQAPPASTQPGSQPATTP